MDNQYTTAEGREFFFGKLPAYDSVRVQVMLLKVLGEPLFQAATKKGKSATKDELGNLAIGSMLSLLSEDEVIRLIDIVMQRVTIRESSNKPPVRVNVDQHFQDTPRDVWLVLMQALRYNFADFLPESLFTSLKEKMAQALSQSSQQTSTGSSGDQ